ncbi:MAG: response regulator [Desulfocapsaceae bacterium]|jgi:DNA-binding response OmpR family regulator|nr:response regulator [Desulfocapsaceae bacterium]
MKRILVIDDEELIRTFLRDLLEEEGYEVIIAANGEEGLAVFDTQSVDLVITDIIMPVKDGLDTILELKKKAPELPVIAISAGGNIPKERYLAVAAYMKKTVTLAKPFTRQELLSAVKEQLNPGDSSEGLSL